MPVFPPRGVTSLSQLIIDVDKDWGGYVIKNIGEPVEPYDAARKKYVDFATTGLGLNLFLLDQADSEVTTYKSMSVEVPELSEAYVEYSTSSHGDYEIAAWIAPADIIPVVRLGVYELYCQAERPSGNIPVRLFFRLYERQTDGTEILIGESAISDRIDGRRDVVVSLVLASDYIMQPGSRLVMKLYARYEEYGGSSTTVRVYYQGNVRSRLATPIAKEILDTLYVPYTGAKYDLDLGGKNISNVGSLSVSNQVTVGDLVFKNGYRIAEHPEYGLILITPDNRKFRLVLEEVK